jgi:hypothetical protein
MCSTLEEDDGLTDNAIAGLWLKPELDGVFIPHSCLHLHIWTCGNFARQARLALVDERAIRLFKHDHRLMSRIRGEYEESTSEVDVVFVVKITVVPRGANGGAGGVCGNVVIKNELRPCSCTQDSGVDDRALD